MFTQPLSVKEILDELEFLRAITTESYPSQEMKFRATFKKITKLMFC